VIPKLRWPFWWLKGDHGAPDIFDYIGPMRDSLCSEVIGSLGERMVADLGTKALTSTRIEVLKSMLGMNKVDRPAEEEGEVNEKPEKKAIKTGVAEVAATAIKLITLAATLPVSNAQEEEEENYGELCQLMMIYTVLVVLITIVVQTLWKVGVRQCGRNLNEWVFGRDRSLRRWTRNVASATEQWRVG